MDKDEVRRQFPTVIAFADEVRAVFGDGVKLVYAKENGREIGKRVVHDPASVVKLSDMCLDSFVGDDEERPSRGKK